MGNEKSRPYTPNTESNEQTKYNTLPKGKKISAFQYRYLGKSPEPQKKPNYSNTLQPGQEILKNNVDISKSKDKELREILRLRKELVSKDIEINNLKGIIQNSTSKSEEIDDKEIKLDLEKMTQKYLDAKFKYFVMKEENSVLEDQLDSQEHELEGIQNAYFALKKSQEIRASRRNQIIQHLRKENDKLKQQLHSKIIDKRRSKVEYTRLRKSFIIVRETLHEIIAGNANVLIAGEQKDSLYNCKSNEENLKLNTNPNYSFTKPRSFQLKDNAVYKKPEYINLTRTRQFDVDFPNENVVLTKFLKVNGMFVKLSLAEFSSNRLKITFKLKNSMAKDIYRLEEKLDLAHQVIENSHWTIKQCNISKIEVVGLKNKLLKYKKLLESSRKKLSLQETTLRREFTKINTLVASTPTRNDAQFIFPCSENSTIDPVTQAPSPIRSLDKNNTEFSTELDVKDSKFYNSKKASIPSNTCSIVTQGEDCSSELFSTARGTVSKERLLSFKAKFDILVKLFNEIRNFQEEYISNEIYLHIALNEKEQQIQQLKHSQSALKSQLHNEIEKKTENDVVCESMKSKIESFANAINLDTPTGWSKRWAAWSGQFYYVNEFTNQAQWERPS